MRTKFPGKQRVAYSQGAGATQNPEQPMEHNGVCFPMRVCSTSAENRSVESVRSRARFFYFLNYKDLVQQLVAEGWINEEQHAAVVRAHDATSVSELLQP